MDSPKHKQYIRCCRFIRLMPSSGLALFDLTALMAAQGATIFLMQFIYSYREKATSVAIDQSPFAIRCPPSRQENSRKIVTDYSRHRTNEELFSQPASHLPLCLYRRRYFTSTRWKDTYTHVYAHSSLDPQSRNSTEAEK